MTNRVNKKIEEYYDDTQILYNLFWSKNAFHYGFWEEGTKNLSAAFMNENKFVADCLEINGNDVVLDAGCGVGGTSLFIAEKYRAKVFGINISDTQLKIAKQNLLKSKVTNLINFSNQDFTKTNFKDSTFSKIFGIESICHAFDKLDFLNEAYRILKKGGKIVVVDAFLIRTNFNEKEKEYYEKFLNGWAVPNLSTKDNFYNNLKKSGFRNVKYYDKSLAVKPSCIRIFLMYIALYPFTLFLSKMRIIPKNMHEHVIASINQAMMAMNNMVRYGVFVAEK